MAVCPHPIRGNTVVRIQERKVAFGLPRTEHFKSGELENVIISQPGG